MTDTRPVCVLGMHRSGTSLVARMLNHCGVDLGSEDVLLGAADDNPRGFWEHTLVVDVNDQLLVAGGTDWTLPVPPANGWLENPSADLVSTARSIVAPLADNESRWGWKDPRTSMTLPFWEGIVGPCAPVLCLRHPDSVARSLEAREDVVAADAWLYYNLCILRHVDRRDLIVVEYEALLADPRPQIERVLARLGIEPDDQQVERAVSEVSPDLQHHRITSSEHLSPADRVIYDNLSAMSRDESPEASFDEALDLLSSIYEARASRTPGYRDLQMHNQAVTWDLAAHSEELRVTQERLYIQDQNVGNIRTSRGYRYARKVGLMPPLKVYDGRRI